MTAIETHYLGPTDHKSARIVARGTSGRKVTVSYSHALDAPANHRAAMEAWVARYGAEQGWATRCAWVQGETARGYAFVRVFAIDRIAAAMRLIPSECDPEEAVAFGDVVRETANALQGDALAFAAACGLADRRVDQIKTCQPECDCVCHATSEDACNGCQGDTAAA
jgi:hypothetical protein